MVKSRILLLRCGHIKFLDEAVEAECYKCAGSDVLDSPYDPFELGYKAGLGARLGFDIEGVARLAEAWLMQAKKEGHPPGCQCGSCKVSRSVIYLAAKKEMGG